MKKSRILLLSILSVLIIVLAACTPAIPPTLASVGGLLRDQTTEAQSVAAESAAVTVSPAQSIVAGDLQDALVRVYEEVNPSVVSIRVRVSLTGRLQQVLPNLPNLPDLPFRFFFGPGSPDSENAPQQQPETPQYSQGLGSGFVWDREGHIVTNNHVVEGADQIYVTFADGTTVSAEVIGSDADSDLAVLKLKSTSGLDLRPVRVGDSTAVKVGQFVVAIGNPFGLENTMTFGIVSAIGRSIPASGQDSVLGNAPSYTIPDVIQTDAAVNPGNSGGVLVDLEGNLVGVPSQIESPVRANAGVGFAIPSAIVQKVVPVLITKGKFEHPWIGISGTTLTPELAEAMDLSSTQRGALVSTVTSGSPAEKAGLRGSTKDVTINGQQVKVGGDVIIAIAGQEVKEFDDLVSYLARQGQVGQQVELTVLRDGKKITVPLTLGARPTAAAQAQTQQQPEQGAARGNAWLGIQGATLTAELAEAMDLGSTQKGVLVVSVAGGSPADKAGLRGSYKSAIVNGQEVMVGGDVIIEADGQAVETMEQLVQIVGSKKAGDRLDLRILRDGETIRVTATLAARVRSGQ